MSLAIGALSLLLPFSAALIPFMFTTWPNIIYSSAPKVDKVDTHPPAAIMLFPIIGLESQLWHNSFLLPYRKDILPDSVECYAYGSSTTRLKRVFDELALDLING
ncbi:hypothetical protein Tco_0668853 [Tanacetum coccineum]